MGYDKTRSITNTNKRKTMSNAVKGKLKQDEKKIVMAYALNLNYNSIVYLKS